MAYLITAGALGPIKLNETDPIASTVQNVGIILRTLEGTVPLYREFGISSEPLHMSIPAAKALLLAEIKEKVERFEPRVTVIGVSFQQTGVGLIPTVEVEMRE